MSSSSTSIQKTLALIKPDAYPNSPDIKSLILQHHFQILKWEPRQLNQQEIRQFYKEHEGKGFFDGLLRYIESGPIIVAVLAKPNAIKEWRHLMGPTDCKLAREEQPQSIRAQFGTDKTRNAVHGSDSEASARREIKFFFPNESLELPGSSTLYQKDQSDLYIKQNLEGVLVEALTALAKEKPKDSVRWLSNWLLENNPNKPKEVGYTVE